MRTTQSANPSARPTARSTRPSSSSRPLPRAEAPAYRPLRYLGRGSFGVVLLAEDTRTGAQVAMKRVRYDPRTHNREVAILKEVLVEREEKQPGSSAGSEATVADWTGRHHPNIVELLDAYVTYDTAVSEAEAAAMFHTSMGVSGAGVREEEYLAQLRQPRYPLSGAGSSSMPGGADFAYLEMVMSYLPMDLHAVKKHFYQHQRLPSAEAAACHDGKTEHGTTTPPSPHRSAGRPSSPKAGVYLPLRWVKIYLFQLARALAFMHAHQVCHRDLKPANVLVDPDSGRVQLCDFGSAKQILRPLEEKNVSYICSRYYRAPELLFGALHYGCEVDMWSFGCLLAELLRESGRPLFRGCTSVDQMAELFKVMGAPSKREMHAMNPHCAEALLRTHAMHRPESAAGTGYGLHDSGSSGGARHFGFMEEEAAELGNRHGGSASASARPSFSTSDGDRGPGSAQALHESLDDGPMAFDEYYDVLKVRAIPWKMLFPIHTPSEALSLVTSLLCYVPQKRLSAADVVEHAFFADLFAPSLGAVEDADLRMPNGRYLPLEMFQLTATERGQYTEAFQMKMARQAELLSAAMETAKMAGDRKSEEG